MKSIRDMYIYIYILTMDNIEWRKALDPDQGFGSRNTV